MKISSLFPGFNISAKGLRIQRKRMNLIAENIANANVTRTSDGEPYKRKFLTITAKQNSFNNNLIYEGNNLKLNTTNGAHISINKATPVDNNNDGQYSLNFNEIVDQTPGDIVYMPGNPNADSDGYVKESNVNIVNEMIDMISASRSYEANLTALNSSKQMIKDSMEI